MKVVQSIERAFAILNEISRSPAGISELSRSTGLPTSTVAKVGFIPFSDSFETLSLIDSSEIFESSLPSNIIADMLVLSH